MSIKALINQNDLGTSELCITTWGTEERAAGLYLQI